MERIKQLQREDTIGRVFITAGGLLLIVLALAIAVFLLWRGSETFTVFHHSVFEFLFSTDFDPVDDTSGGGHVGAAIFILGSIITCAIALLIATPLSVGTAIFITDISPKFGKTVIQTTVDMFVGIPSVVYGWLGLTILVPAIKNLFHLQTGFSVLAASIVLAIMIFPTITSLATDALRAVPKSYRVAAYALGSTRWQMLYKIILPAATKGIISATILGLARAFGEALAVAMVIGKMRAIPHSIFSPTVNLTSAIASDMGGAMEGGEYNMALWSMALLLFIISALFIFIIHCITGKKAV